MRILHVVPLFYPGLLGQYIRWADVVHFTQVYNLPTFPGCSTVGCSRNLSSGRPVADCSVGKAHPAAPLKAIWDSLRYNLADRPRLTLHCTSQEEAREGMVRLPNLRSAVIPNGVDVPSTLNRPEAHGRLRLLYGRLDPKKEIEELLKACSMMAGNNWPLRGGVHRPTLRI